jgi:hypothetical protein
MNLAALKGRFAEDGTIEILVEPTHARYPEAAAFLAKLLKAQSGATAAAVTSIESTPSDHYESHQKGPTQ